MNFVVFQLLFAAVAIALIVVAVLIVRRTRHRRDRTAHSDRPRKAARPSRPLGLGRKAPPAVEPPAEAPPRRRQLQSFVDQERGHAGEPAPAAEAAEPAAPTVFVEPEPLPQPDAGPQAEPDVDQAVMARLEAAFEALQAGEITLETYREGVLAEQAALDARIAALRPQADGLTDEGAESEELGAALAARESVRWCLNWADEQGGASG